MSGEDIVIVDHDDPPAAGGHLTYDEIEAWVDGGGGDIDRELVDGHMEVCELCRSEVTDLVRVRESLRRTPASGLRTRRRWLPAAAIVVVGLASSLLLFRRDTGSPRRPIEPSRAAVEQSPLRRSTAMEAREPTTLPILSKPLILAALIPDRGMLRGGSDRGAFALHEPVGTVVLDARPQFRWAALSGADTYTVIVADQQTGRVAATGRTTTIAWRPPIPLQRGRIYSWQVTARRGDDEAIVPQPSDAEALFQIATEPKIEEVEAMTDDHLQRGIVLAERGVLDEAERALRLALESGDARANDVMDQVRSWRQSARPTRTKGAQ